MAAWSGGPGPKHALRRVRRRRDPLVLEPRLQRDARQVELRDDLLVREPALPREVVPRQLAPLPGLNRAASQPPDSSPPPPEPGLDPLPLLSPAVAAMRRRWRDLIRRVFETDPLLCPRCGSLVRVVAFITARSAIRAILDHLARRTCDGRGPPS